MCNALKVITEILIDHEADEVINELFNSLKNRYQKYLESRYQWEVASLYLIMFSNCHKIKLHKINLNCGGSNIDFLDWIKKATINPINKNKNKCLIK